MPNNKIKILAAFSLISLVVTVLIFAPNFSAQAENDSFVNEITDYKTWTKITKEPFKVASYASTVIGI